jgi:uncharacterized membrane protein
MTWGSQSSGSFLALAWATSAGAAIVPKKLTNAIAIVVTFVWTASVLADILLPSYDPQPYVHFAMMAVVGAAFGASVFKDSK